MKLPSSRSSFNLGSRSSILPRVEPLLRKSSIVLGMLESTRNFVRLLIFIFSVFLIFDVNRLLREQFQKSWAKQGLKFKMRTKVLSAEKKDGKAIVTTEPAKDGKQETVRSFQLSCCKQRGHIGDSY